VTLNTYFNCFYFLGFTRGEGQNKTELRKLIRTQDVCQVKKSRYSCSSLYQSSAHTGGKTLHWGLGYVVLFAEMSRLTEYRSDVTTADLFLDEAHLVNRKIHKEEHYLLLQLGVFRLCFLQNR
jgi:hypothetical protein